MTWIWKNDCSICSFFVPFFFVSKCFKIWFSNITIFGLINWHDSHHKQQGMASGLETLCGQAYGAQQYQKLGIQTYRAILSLVVVCLPISLIWVSMGKILLLTGQDPLISQEAGKYAVWMIPGLFAYATVQPLMKFLQSQSLILPMLLSSLTTLCLHIPLCWVMVYKSGLGNIGAALSISISYWLNVFMLVLYIRYSVSCKTTRSPISKECFRGIDEFLKLAIPSAVMLW